MRRFISLLRKIIIGPTLDSLSHLSEGEVQIIKNFTSSDNQLFNVYCGAGGGTPAAALSSFSTPPDFNPDFLQAKVTELTSTIVTLEERIEVLERLLVNKPC